MFAPSVPDTQIVPQNHHLDTRWLQYFDPRAAMASVAAHIESLPSARTPERHTARVYETGLKYFLAWANWELPTEDLMQGFIAHLLNKGLRSATVASKYLAPARLYLNKLAGQHITGFTGEARDYISDCREHLRAAAGVRTPRADVSTNVAPLWRADFVRLELKQVNAVLRSLPRPALSALRDYALLHIAFSTGLRLAELSRITLDAIQPIEGDFLITVRGKRSNIDPVPISAQAMTDLLAWVEAYNAELDPDDPRRITGDRPVWQPLTRSDRHMPVGVNNYDPVRGMSHQALRDLIARRTRAALGDKFECAPHDMRRSAAAMAYDAGMNITDIQQLLRHKDASTTMRYVGTKPDFHKRKLASYVSFG